MPMHVMLYHYVDETYKQVRGYWHCNIGGLLVPASSVVDFETSVCKAIFTESETGISLAQEAKYSSFFKDLSDTKKQAVFSALVRNILEFDIEIIVSHTYMAKWKMQEQLNKLKPPIANIEATPDQPRAELQKKQPGLQMVPSESFMIQYLAWDNMNRYLAGITANTQVQTVVDLGIHKSFKPIYDLYINSFSTIPQLSAIGFPEESITIPNFRNYLPPVFVDSKDSRAIQISDTIIGILLARRTGTLSSFWEKISNELVQIKHKIHEHSVEWNKKVT